MEKNFQQRNGMQSLNNLFEAALNPVLQQQTAKARKQFKPAFARFKLKFYYLDGNESVHFSYDFYFEYQNGVKKKIEDESLGFSKLLNCIKKNEGLYKTAMIWATPCTIKNTDDHKYKIEVFKHIRNQNATSNKPQLNAILMRKEAANA